MQIEKQTMAKFKVLSSLWSLLLNPLWWTWCSFRCNFCPYLWFTLQGQGSPTQPLLLRITGLCPWQFSHLQHNELSSCVLIYDKCLIAISSFAFILILCRCFINSSSWSKISINGILVSCRSFLFLLSPKLFISPLMVYQVLEIEEISGIVRSLQV